MGQCGIEYQKQHTQFQIGVFDTIAHFNIGKKSVLLIYEKLGMKPGYFTTIGCSKLNNARLINAYKPSCEVRINRRRHLRGAQKTRSDKYKETEGVVYGAGEFTVE